MRKMMERKRYKKKMVEVREEEIKEV